MQLMKISMHKLRNFSGLVFISEYCIGMAKEVLYYEYCLAKAVLDWFVWAKILSREEADLVDLLNRVDFGVER